MRLWTIHPRYLDPQGLVALSRESLLAKAVLRGRRRRQRAAMSGGTRSAVGPKLEVETR